eukprot:SAG11_NODE_4488_length_1877_cov_1.387514_1_plen_146_part_00
MMLRRVLGSAKDGDEHFGGWRLLVEERRGAAKQFEMAEQLLRKLRNLQVIWPVSYCHRILEIRSGDLMPKTAPMNWALQAARALATWRDNVDAAIELRQQQQTMWAAVFTLLRAQLKAAWSASQASNQLTRRTDRHMHYPMHQTH